MLITLCYGNIMLPYIMVIPWYGTMVMNTKNTAHEKWKSTSKLFLKAMHN